MVLAEKIQTISLSRGSRQWPSMNWGGLYGCSSCGGFLEWWCPWIIHLNGIFHCKPFISIHFGDPPFMQTPTGCVYVCMPVLTKPLLGLVRVQKQEFHPDMANNVVVSKSETHFASHGCDFSELLSLMVCPAWPATGMVPGVDVHAFTIPCCFQSWDIRGVSAGGNYLALCRVCAECLAGDSWGLHTIRMQWISESMNCWFHESMTQWLNESTSLDESFNQVINESMNGCAWVDKSMNQRVHESMNEWIFMWVDDSLNQWTVMNLSSGGFPIGNQKQYLQRMHAERLPWLYPQ